MCDTIVALPPATATGSVLFGKNSDRERNEAQAVEALPRARHAPDERLRCTHISVPQVRETHAVLLCRPFWMWGAEMGANEHGVAIGNEAVHARIPPQQEPALLGMDLLRLALERAASAAKAVDTIIELLEQFGQGGNCGHLTQRHYHNSFLVADPKEAFVLETVGRMWVVQRAKDVRAISNAYTIGRDYDRISPALLDYAWVEGWRTGLRFDVAELLSNLQQDAISNGRARCARSTGLLQAAQGTLDTAAMIGVLRDHGAAADGSPDWHPQHAPLRTVCMHAADGERTGQTVNSMVSELRAGQAVHWVTGTAAPCLSIFKPIVPGVPLPAQGPRPKDKCDPATLWWRHETAAPGDAGGLLRPPRRAVRRTRRAGARVPQPHRRRADGRLGRRSGARGRGLLGGGGGGGTALGHQAGAGRRGGAASRIPRRLGGDEPAGWNDVTRAVRARVPLTPRNR